MVSRLADIEAKAQRLPAAERERLAQKLFESVHHKELNDVDDAWLSVAAERLASYRSGKDSGLQEDEFFAQVEKNLGWR